MGKFSSKPFPMTNHKSSMIKTPLFTIINNYHYQLCISAIINPLLTSFSGLPELLKNPQLSWVSLDASEVKMPVQRFCPVSKTCCKRPWKQRASTPWPSAPLRFRRNTCSLLLELELSTKIWGQNPERTGIFSTIWWYLAGEIYENPCGESNSRAASPCLGCPNSK